MNKYFQYLKYLLRHKYYVFIEGWKLRVPIWQLIFHDWDKFLPFNFKSYTNHFYSFGFNNSEYDHNFELSWNNHQKINKHHWEYWCLINYWGEINPIQMPYHDIIEMLADWSGASRAKHGINDIVKWYESHKKEIVLHSDTRSIIEGIIRGFYNT